MTKQLISDLTKCMSILCKYLTDNDIRIEHYHREFIYSTLNECLMYVLTEGGDDSESDNINN